MRKCQVVVLKEVEEYRESKKAVEDGVTKFNIALNLVYGNDKILVRDILKVDELDGQELKFHEFTSDNGRAVAIVEDVNGRVHLVKADYLKFID